MKKKKEVANKVRRRRRDATNSSKLDRDTWSRVISGEDDREKNLRSMSEGCSEGYRAPLILGETPASVVVVVLRCDGKNLVQKSRLRVSFEYEDIGLRGRGQ